MKDSELVDEMITELNRAREIIEEFQGEMKYPDAARGYLEGALGNLEQAEDTFNTAAAYLEQHEAEQEE